MVEKNRYRVRLQALEAQLDSVTLTDEQERVCDKLIDWYVNWNTPEVDHSPAVLAAFGGAGKSFLFSQFILKLVYKFTLEGKLTYTDEFRVCLMAPSNRAVEVMREFSQEFGLWRFCKVTCMSVQAFSGMTMDKLDGDAYREELWLDREEDQQPYSLLVPDEYGMIGEELWKKRLANHHAMPILYSGNLEQLPPVNSVTLSGTSPVDENYPNYYFTLKQVKRNSGGILAYSRQLLQQYALADLRISRLVEELIEDMGGIDPRFSAKHSLYFNPKKDIALPFELTDDVFVGNRQEVIQELLSTGIISSDLAENCTNEFLKTLCYTNSAVSDWNKITRSLIYGQAAKMIYKGEPFLVKSPLYVLDPERKVMQKAFYTNEFITLDRVESLELKFQDVFNIPDNCVTFPDVTIPILRVYSTTRYNDDVSFLYANNAKVFSYLSEFFMFWFKKIGEFENRDYRKQQYNYWEATIRYWGFKYDDDPKAKHPFSRFIVAAHAATVHSAQGSTFDHVVVDLDNIIEQRASFDTKLRLTYTACSRAKKRLYLVTSNNMDNH